MATISKETIAQFWLNAFPISSKCENISFSDTSIVQNLLNFGSSNKVFDRIQEYIKDTKLRKLNKSTSPKQRQRLTKNTLININPKIVKFNIHIDVLEDIEYEEEQEVPMMIETKIEDRTIENLMTLFHETDPNVISTRFDKLIYSWLMDVSFNITNDVFLIIVDLMNKYPDEFFRCCFVPWLKNSTDNMNLFLSNLFIQIINVNDRCKLCTYLCQNSTCPFNDNELCIINNWFDSKEYYFSDDLLSILIEKISMSSKIYSDNLTFAKLIHKILIKSNENNHILTDEQRLIFKQVISINTTILSDILMDLLD